MQAQTYLSILRKYYLFSCLRVCMLSCSVLSDSVRPHGVSQARRLGWGVATSYCRVPSRPKVKPLSLAAPELAGRFSTTVSPGKPLLCLKCAQNACFSHFEFHVFTSSRTYQINFFFLVNLSYVNLIICPATKLRREEEKTASFLELWCQYGTLQWLTPLLWVTPERDPGTSDKNWQKV